VNTDNLKLNDIKKHRLTKMEKKTTTLLLTRHGETFDNERQIMQGQTQGELNENGIKQARELAQTLQSKNIDAVVASDLKRAIDTAKIIASTKGLSVETTPLLRERDWGGFTGRYIPELKDEKWPDDIESLDALKQRAAKFLELLKQKYPGMTVVAVGHGIINKAIQAVFYGKEMNQVMRMANAEVRELTIDN